MSEEESYYYCEWKYNTKLYGNKGYAKAMKEKYRQTVMERLTKPDYIQDVSMRQFPLINLN